MNAPLQIFRENGSQDIPGSTLGVRLAEIRRSRGLTLKELSASTGIPVSTLSKVQNSQATLSYESLVKLSVGLGVDVGEFFRLHPNELRTTRRAIERKDQGRRGSGERYSFEILATELARKRMVPGILTVTATSLEEIGGLSRHEGEEFIYVLSGSSTYCRGRCGCTPSSTNPQHSRPATAPISTAPWGTPMSPSARAGSCRPAFSRSARTHPIRRRVPA